MYPYPEDFEEEDFEECEYCQNQEEKENLLEQYRLAQVCGDVYEIMDLAIELYTRFGCF